MWTQAMVAQVTDPGGFILLRDPVKAAMLTTTAEYQIIPPMED